MLAVTTLFIVLVWAACALVLIGIGLLAFRASRYFSVSEAFWTGLGSVVAFLLLYHFFRPVDAWAGGLVACLGIAGALINRHTLVQGLRESLNARGRLLFVYASLVFTIALRASSDWFHYDTGLYGALAVRWITTYPLVPGLANLHIRLAYNSSVFLCVALLNHSFLRILAHHLFPGLLLSAFVASILPPVFQLFNRQTASASAWFTSILAIPVGFHAVRGDVVGDITDLPTTIVCLAGSMILFRELSVENDVEKRPESLVVAATLFSLAISFKLSALVFAALGWLIALWILARYAHTTKDWQLARKASLFSLAIGIPWVIRGCFLSGYPLYPSTAISIPADWRVPLSAAKAEAVDVYSWARIAGVSPGSIELQGLRWINTWIHRVWVLRESFSGPFILTIVALFMLFLSLWGSAGRNRPRWLYLLIPSVCGLIFWFVCAPDPRFGEPAIWCTAAVLASSVIVKLVRNAGVRRNRIILFFLFALWLWCLLPARDLAGRYWGLRHFHGLVRLTESQLQPNQTRSGLIVFVPVDDDRCWDKELVCTPGFNANLRLRRPGNLRWGFTSEDIP
jgi:hypothetical protein